MPAARTRKPPTPPPPPVEEVEEDGIPDVEKRSRTPKMQKLESSVAGLYIMVGGGLSTLPEQVGGTRVRLVGLSVARSADEIAEAWIDLAEDDRRVLKILESLTSFSGWGKVIGVHLIAVGSAVPGIAAAMPAAQFGAGAFSPFQPQPQQPQPQGNGMADMQQAMMIAEAFRQMQSAERAAAAAAPPPGFGQAPTPPPVPQQQQQAGVRPVGQPQQQPQTRPGRNAGIPSPAELFGGGAPTADAPLDFPTAGPADAGM